MKYQQLFSSLLSYKGESDDCPGGCSYYRQGDPLTVYCFGPGERSGNPECAVTTTGELGGKNEEDKTWSSVSNSSFLIVFN